MSGQGSPLGMSAFLPFLARCSSHSNYMARHMAAKAIVSLVPNNTLASFLPELVESLPAAAAERKTPLHHNQLHGTLLQAYRLLLRVVEHKDVAWQQQIVRKLGPALSHKQWLGSAAMHCAPVRCLYVDIFAAFTDLCVSLNVTGAGESLENLRKHTLVMALGASDVPPASLATAQAFDGVGVKMLRTHAARIALRCIFTYVLCLIES